VTPAPRLNSGLDLSPTRSRLVRTEAAARRRPGSRVASGRITARPGPSGPARLPVVPARRRRRRPSHLAPARCRHRGGDRRQLTDSPEAGRPGAGGGHLETLPNFDIECRTFDIVILRYHDIEGATFDHIEGRKMTVDIGYDMTTGYRMF
jgi:hypothetical protein